MMQHIDDSKAILLYLFALAREHRANFAAFDSGIPAAAIEEGEAILHVIRSSGPASESVSDC